MGQVVEKNFQGLGMYMCGYGMDLGGFMVIHGVTSDALCLPLHSAGLGSFDHSSVLSE